MHFLIVLGLLRDKIISPLFSRRPDFGHPQPVDEYIRIRIHPKRGGFPQIVDQTWTGDLI